MSALYPEIARTLSKYAPLFDAFQQAGFQLYAVGGCVRDWLLGKTPKDIDFTTDATPDQTSHVLASHGYKVIPLGESFGTIATIIERKNYEITTFRVKESYTRGSRHPVVRYGKELSLDLERRDLTINAMAATREGVVMDPFGGAEDIEKHILRVPRSSYSKSLEIFGDDPLRILRIARFKARLGFDVCEDATRAATDMAGSVLTVSRERWYAEIDGLLLADNPCAGLDWLRQTGVWQLLFPETLSLENVLVQPSDLSGGPVSVSENSLWKLTLQRIQAAPKISNMKWAALLSLFGYSASKNGLWAESVSRMMASDILARLKFSNVRTAAILSLLTLLPSGLPGYRAVRELAVSLTDIPAWIEFQQLRIQTLPDETQNAESERFRLWVDSLQPYVQNPQSAEVHLPAGLSKYLSLELGIQGKILGLCITRCRDAVLDQRISENAPCEDFVNFIRNQS